MAVTKPAKTPDPRDAARGVPRLRRIVEAHNNGPARGRSSMAEQKLPKFLALAKFGRLYDFSPKVSPINTAGLPQAVVKICGSDQAHWGGGLINGDSPKVKYTGSSRMRRLTSSLA